MYNDFASATHTIHAMAFARPILLLCIVEEICQLQYTFEVPSILCYKKYEQMNFKRNRTVLIEFSRWMVFSLFGCAFSCTLPRPLGEFFSWVFFNWFEPLASNKSNPNRSPNQIDRDLKLTISYYNVGFPRGCVNTVKRVLDHAHSMEFSYVWLQFSLCQAQGSSIAV